MSRYWPKKFQIRPPAPTLVTMDERKWIFLNHYFILNKSKFQKITNTARTLSPHNKSNHFGFQIDTLKRTNQRSDYQPMRERAWSTSLVTYLKCFTKHLKNLLKSFPMVLDRSLQTLVDIKGKSLLKVILEMDFKIFSYKILVFNLYKSISTIGSISTGANLMICQFK